MPSGQLALERGRQHRSPKALPSPLNSADAVCQAVSGVDKQRVPGKSLFLLSERRYYEGERLQFCSVYVFLSDLLLHDAGDVATPVWAVDNQIGPLWVDLFVETHSDQV